MSTPADAVLEVTDLRVNFQTEAGVLPAVDGASFSIRRGRTLALVGESGCGKSVTSNSILRLIQRPGKIDGGKITLNSLHAGAIDITGLDDRSPRLFHVRGGLVSMIFQEPMTALSPVHTVGDQIMEAILVHHAAGKKEARRKAIEMLGKVGVSAPERRFHQYPHEMSGGMRQRVVIAMALVCRPELLIADEPTTALDVTLQAQILALIKTLQQEINCAVLFITHDLGVVAQMADDVAVMYLGRIVEHGPMEEVLKRPLHPYTQGLLRSIPTPDSGSRLSSIAGGVPSLNAIPSGCPFHPRCPHFQAPLCNHGGPPPLRLLDSVRSVACLRVEETAQGFALPPDDPARMPQLAVPSPSANGADGSEPLLSVRHLTKSFNIRGPGLFRRSTTAMFAVDDVSFDLFPGETLGLVGESGSGKTTTVRCLLRAVRPTSGQAAFRQANGSPVDLATLSDAALKPLRTQMQMIFQDPYSSLNPRMTVGQIVAEPLQIHGLAKGAELDARVDDTLRKVGLMPEHRNRYPHAFSGGQRQRIGIARALIMRPSLIVADEAVSALDVSVQAQVLNLLKDLQAEFRLTYIFVAHNLNVVRHFCDRVAVMYAGRIVELAPTAQLFKAPLHPYTRALLAAAPQTEPGRKMHFERGGESVDPAQLPE